MANGAGAGAAGGGNDVGHSGAACGVITGEIVLGEVAIGVPGCGEMMGGGPTGGVDCCG